MRYQLLPLLALLPATLAAQQPQPQPKMPPTCTTPNHAAFDYWVGEWVVADTAGKDIAESSITKLADGCAVLEVWRPKQGPPGTSLNWFETTDKQWHQVWVAGATPSVTFIGNVVDGAMVMTTAGPGPGPQGRWARGRWLLRPGGVVRQIFENSTDGKSWSVGFVGDYRRKH